MVVVEGADMTGVRSVCVRGAHDAAGHITMLGLTN